MGLPLRCRYCSVLQVVAIVVCCRGNVSSERAQECVGSKLSLRCEEMNVIQITTVVLGDSYCAWPLSCCIRDNDCTRNANANHRTDVRHRCDNRQNCTVGVLKESIYCGFVSWSNNDFERITYNCVNETRNVTTNSTADEEQIMEPDNSEAITIILVVICLIILLAIVVLAVVMYRRKKRAQMKLSNPVAMTEVNNRQNEYDISGNETQGTNQHENNDPLSLYTVIDEDDFPKTNGDPAVYSEVELRETVWKKGQSDTVTTNKIKAAMEAHAAGTDVYAAVNKPSKNPATSSALKTDQLGEKDIANKGDCFPDQIYSLASNETADTYANESPTRVFAEGVSITPSPEDDGGQTVIENDLYCH